MKLRTFIEQRGWDATVVDSHTILSRSPDGQTIDRYELADPESLFRSRDKYDQKLFYEIGLVPFGACGNGDILVLNTNARNGLILGSVYLVSHDYAYEEAVDNAEIMTKLCRYIASSSADFFTAARAVVSNLPIDYFDGNDDPYRPEYMKRAKKIMKKND